MTPAVRNASRRAGNTSRRAAVLRVERRDGERDAEYGVARGAPPSSRHPQPAPHGRNAPSAGRGVIHQRAGRHRAVATLAADPAPRVAVDSSAYRRPAVVAAYEYADTRANEARPHAARRSSSASTWTSASASAAKSPVGNTIPLRPVSTRSSAHPTCELTTTGRSRHIASFTANPHVSLGTETRQYEQVAGRVCPGHRALVLEGGEEHTGIPVGPASQFRLQSSGTDE